MIDLKELLSWISFFVGGFFLVPIGFYRSMKHLKYSGTIALVGFILVVLGFSGLLLYF